jgi:hypothetical protein
MEKYKYLVREVHKVFHSFALKHDCQDKKVYKYGAGVEDSRRGGRGRWRRDERKI